MSFNAEQEKRAKQALSQVKLQVGAEEAEKCLKGIYHKLFVKGFAGHWRLDHSDHVKRESICWLFCWAATGINSEETACICRQAFNKIFDHTYEWFDREVSLALARKWRYSNSKGYAIYI